MNDFLTRAARLTIACAAPAIWLASASFAQQPVSSAASAQIEVAEDEELIVPAGDLALDNAAPDSVQVLDGASLISNAFLEEGSLRLVPAQDTSGAFSLRLYYSNAGTTRRVDRSGVIRPRTDLRAGVLQSTETHEGRPGIVRVYTTDRELLAEVNADESGRFPAAQLPLDRKRYVVQAAITRDGERFGFVRTDTVEISQAGEDLELPVIRAVSFDGLAETGMDSLAFREHVLRVTRGVVKRWDLEAINGVFVVGRTPRGRFSAREIERLRGLFSEAGAVPAFLRGTVLRSHDAGSYPEAPYVHYGGKIEPKPGWIVVAPDSAIDVSSESSVKDVDGVYNRGLILINSPRAARFGSMERLVTYEVGRVLGMTANSDPLFFIHTMMVSGGGPQVPERPTAIDKKTGAIIYEESFPVHLDLHLVLGLEFDSATADLTRSDG